MKQKRKSVAKHSFSSLLWISQQNYDLYSFTDYFNKKTDTIFSLSGLVIALTQQDVNCSNEEEYVLRYNLRNLIFSETKENFK